MLLTFIACDASPSLTTISWKIPYERLPCTKFIFQFYGSITSVCRFVHFHEVAFGVHKGKVKYWNNFMERLQDTFILAQFYMFMYILNAKQLFHKYVSRHFSLMELKRKFNSFRSILRQFISPIAYARSLFITRPISIDGVLQKIKTRP